MRTDDMTQDEGSGTALNAAREGFYDMQGGNLSGTSIDSEALLDHRYCPSRKPFQNPRRIQLTIAPEISHHSFDPGGRPL